MFRPTVTKEMFANCTSLTELDFKSRFKFSDLRSDSNSVNKYPIIQNCSGMFLNCTSLRTIWSHKDEPWIVTSDGISTNMFKGCTSLKGPTYSYTQIGESILSNNNYGIRFANTSTQGYSLLKYR